MIIEEYIKEHRKRVANMTLAQARQVVADHYGHDDMRIECEKAVWMLLNCADEKINNGWIPVSEKPPEEHICDDGFHEPSESVLVQMKSGEMHTARYWSRYDERWLGLDYPTTDEVIAWRSLPEPYKAESEKA